MVDCCWCYWMVVGIAAWLEWGCVCTVEHGGVCMVWYAWDCMLCSMMSVFYSAYNISIVG